MATTTAAATNILVIRLILFVISVIYTSSICTRNVMLGITMPSNERTQLIPDLTLRIPQELI